MWRGISASASLLLVLLLAALSPAAAASAGFGLRLSVVGLSPGEVPVLERFLREVEPRVPARVQAALPQAVLVSFDLRPEPPEPPLYREPSIAVPDCPSFDGVTDSRSTRLRRPQELAELDRGDPPTQASRIRLHRGFRAIIARGPKAAVRYPCGHRSLYQLAVATLLHEVMHLYDARAGLSRDPRYQHLQRFDRQGLFRRMAPRNQLILRSPDPYESVSLAESVAVNAEYFLLDPEYRCRRPASYAFFEAALRYRPFSHAPCTPNFTVYSRGEPYRLDPERIYQVHYLMAARGEGIASRFGHGMFRLVICSAERQAPGPECLDDVQDHVVLGFGANLQADLQISAWKGLFGGYVSQLFVKSLPDVLIEYTERELRGLESFPLRLDRDELQQLVRRALEIYWSYEGRYFFLSNNCASEALSLLKSASANPALQRISRMTPAGLRDALLQAGLVDLPPLPSGPAGLREKERMGLYFPSLSSRYLSAYEGLQAHLPEAAPRTLQAYLLNSQATQRRQWLQSLLALPVELGLPLSAQAFALEGLILGKRFADLERIFARFVLHNLDAMPASLSRLRVLLPRLGIELPWLLTVSGYGIPFPSEVRRPPDVERDAAYRLLWQEAQRILRASSSSELAEWQSTQDNRRWLAEHVLAASVAQRRSASASLSLRSLGPLPATRRDAAEIHARGGMR